MKKYNVTVNGEKFIVEVEEAGSSASVAAPAVTSSPAPAVTPTPVPTAAPAAASASAKPDAPQAAAGDIVIKSPLPGNVLKVNCQPGQSVKAGDVLLVLEAMKMENDIVAPEAGTIKSVAVAVGAVVQTDDLLLIMA